MSILSNFEDRVSNLFEGVAGSLFRSPVEPVQIARAAEKEMVKNKLVGLGKTYAPTLYTVLLSPADDENLSGFYPTLSSEFGTFLVGKASEENLYLTAKPFVRFLVDDELSTGKFSVFAESVSEDELYEVRTEEEAFWTEQSGEPLYKSTAPAHEPEPVPPPYIPEVNAQPEPGFGPGVGTPMPVPSSTPVKDPFEFGSSPISGPVTPPVEPQAAAPTAQYDIGAGAPQQPQQFAPQATLIDVKSGQPIPLVGKIRYLVGRDSTCDVAVQDVNVSRNHAEIFFDGSSWNIKDLGSTNGTILNDQKITSGTLHSGDSLIFGVSRFDFEER